MDEVVANLSSAEDVMGGEWRTASAGEELREPWCLPRYHRETRRLQNGDERTVQTLVLVRQSCLVCAAC